MKTLSKAIDRRHKAEKKRRRQRILNGARKVFFKKGYIGATMRDIALEAELSAGLIYHYFKNKDDIYSTICEEAFQVLLSLLRNAQKNEGSIDERLAAIADAYLTFYTEYPEYFDILSFKELGFKKVGLSEENMRRLDHLSYESLSILYNEVRQGIKNGFLAPGSEPWEMTFALWAVIEGLIFIHKRGYLDMYGLELRQIFERQLPLVVKGISGG